MVSSKAMRVLQILLVVLAIAAVPALSGGYGRREVEDTAFILAVGFDKGEDGMYSVTTQVAIPAKAKEGGGGGGDLPVMVVTNTGRTVADAVQKFALSSNKEPFWGHVREAVFGEALAREGILPVLDFLARSHEPRVLMWTMVTPGLARDILAAKSQTENLPAMYLSGLIDEAKFHSMAPQTTLFQTILAVDARTGDPLLPKIAKVQPAGQVKPGETGGGGQAAQAGGGQSGGGQSEGGGEAQGGGAGSANPVSLQGSGVFRDDKLVGWLNEEETRGVLWLRGEVKTAIVDFADPKNGLSGVARVMAASHAVAVTVDPSDLSKSRFRITIHADAQVMEYTSGPDLSQVGGRMAVEDATAAAIKQEAEGALHRLQTEFKADAIELGEHVREKLSNAAWDQARPTWFDAFPNVTIEVVVDLKVRRPGLMTGHLGLGRH